LSFESWYQLGYWNQNYIPYTLFEGGKALANVSVNQMNFNIIGKNYSAVQIGTVMTDENYRCQGLCR